MRVEYTGTAELTQPSWLDSAVDDAGNTFILGSFHDGSTPSGTQDAIVEFDTDGAFVAITPLGDFVAYGGRLIRARGNTVAVGGVKNVFGPQQMLVFTLDTSSGTLQRWEGPPQDASSTTFIDVCGDGSVHIKVRCTGSGRTLAAGWTSDGSGYPVAVAIESDGSPAWMWTGSDSQSYTRSFDLDQQGDIAIGAMAGTSDANLMRVYSLDWDGNLRWSWTYGPNDTLLNIAVDDAGDVVVAGMSVVGDSSHFLTAELDSTGAQQWVRDDDLGDTNYVEFAWSVAFDDAGDAFVCGVDGSGRAVLYAPDGSTVWASAQFGFPPMRADVTNGVGRCIGSANGWALEMVGFSVP